MISPGDRGIPPGRPPARARGHAAGPTVRPRGRARALAVVGWVAFAVLVLACGLLTLVAITSETGVIGLITGSVLAMVPVVPVIGCYLWLDRVEAEPVSLLVAVFGWGAAVATFGALVVNTASSEAIQRAGGNPTIESFLVAPFVEEGLKGLAVVLVLVLRRREFDGIVDGLVYAGMVGAGFAFVENVLYLGRTLAVSGAGGTVFVFLLRCVVSPFAHPLFTSATGIGVGIASRTRRPAVAVGAPLAGYLVAVALHGAWNLSASTGLSGFVSVYAVVQLPIFIAFAALALVARRREEKLVAHHLAVYAAGGWLDGGEAAMLGSLAARRRARAWAQRVGGSDARRGMRDFQRLASDLAFLRERMVRGTASGDGQDQELALLTALATVRGRFLPGPPGTPGAGAGHAH